MKRISLLLSLMFGLMGMTIAQNEVDALRYSNLQLMGTARYMGAAGAFGALGADFSTLSTNPAGLGLYKSSEFAFTPSILKTTTLSEYQGESAEDVRYSFNFPHLGYVFTQELGNSEWKHIQFGFGLNKQASFNGKSYIMGVNPHNSMLTDFANQARNVVPANLNQFSTNLAWYTYLLKDTMTVGDDLIYTTVAQGGLEQKKSTITKGGINEMVISLASNYSDKLYLGGTIGFSFIDYYETSTYSESDFMDTISDFKSFTLYDELGTSGTGINFKFGMIYRPIEWLRIGAAVHTPTYYALNDNYYREMSSSFDNGDEYSEESPDGKFNYRLETPMRIIGSAALVLNKYGFVSVDYEFVDYSSARLRSVDTDFNFFDANDAINVKYTAASNLRIGAELRLAPILIRGGYAQYGSPYASNINDGSKKYVTFGLGVRESGFFIDLAYVHCISSEDYYLYSADLVNPAAQEKTSGHVVMTLGFKM